MKVTLMQNVLKANDMFAVETRELLKSKGVRMINLLGSPGAGKTSVLEAILPMLADQGTRVVVIEGDCATSHDADRVAKYNVPVVQINTGNGCHLDANMVNKAIAEFNLDEVDLIVVENVGNLVCPSGFDLGENEKVVVISTTEGADKPLKYPRIFHEASWVILNKVDLIPYTDFNERHFTDYLKQVNDNCECYHVSCRESYGFSTVVSRLFPQELSVNNP